jgi:hypothetical protein
VQDFSVALIQFEQLVREVGGDIKLFAVLRDRETGGNFGLAFRCVGLRQSD